MASPIGQFDSNIVMYGGNAGGIARAESPSWAVKLGKFLKTLFDPDTASPNKPTMHPVSNVGNDMVSTAVTDTSSISYMANAWRVYQHRKSIYQDINRMDHEDEIVSTALDIIADCSVSYSEASDCKPKVTSKNDKVEKILSALVRRLDLADDIWNICRDMVKHGNEMREVVIDRLAMQVVAFKQTISYQIYPTTNKHGDKIPGWTVKTDGDVYTGKEYCLEEWQIVPFIFGAKAGFLGVPPLASARRNWMRLSKIEDGMAIARLVRAYDKIVHRIPVRQDMARDEILSRIRQYKDAISKRRILDSSGLITQVDAPLDVQTDFYLPDDGSGRGGVATLNANNTQLGNLNDVTYQREKLLCRLQVPLAYLQITSQQKTHMTAQAKGKNEVELQFARMLRRVQRHLKKGLFRLFDIELMLHGISPEEGLYDLELTRINTNDIREDADIELTYAQAAVYFVEAFGSLPPDLLADKFMRLNPEQKVLLDTFLGNYGDRIAKARVRGVENKAKPSSGGGKGLAERSTEQPAGKMPAKGQQSIPLDTLVDLFYTITEEINQDFRDQGIDVPELDESHRNVIQSNLIELSGRDVVIE